MVDYRDTRGGCWFESNLILPDLLREGEIMIQLHRNRLFIKHYNPKRCPFCQRLKVDYHMHYKFLNVPIPKTLQYMIDHPELRMPVGSGKTLRFRRYSEDNT